MKRARQNVDVQMDQEDQGTDETGILDWKKIRETKITNYVLEQKGLSNLKMMADTELTGETEDDDDTPSEQEAAKDLERTLEAWTEYLQSVPMKETRKQKCIQFMTDLISSSLYIKEHEDDTGTLSTSVIISSGALTLDWGELFERDPTKIAQLTVCLVYASIFIPAMVVKFYRTFSPKNLLKLVSAQAIHVEWTGLINGRKRITKLIVPKGEIQYFQNKASHLTRNTQDWWMQLVKPMNIRYVNDYGRDIKYSAKTGKFYEEGRIVRAGIETEQIATITVEMQILFYFYAKTVLSQKQKLWKYLQEQVKGLNTCAPSNMQRGSKTTSISQEFWYFKNR